MNTASIISMLGIGVCGSIASTVLVSFGKTTEASFVNIATVSGIGLTALSIVVRLIQMLSQL